jgi:hypothetical protein
MKFSPTPLCCRSARHRQSSEAKAKVKGGFEAYAERLRQEKIEMYEDRLAKGGFLPARA